MSTDGVTVCGDFGRGGYIVLPVARARRWKWAVCWQGSSLWYEPTAVSRHETRQAAQADWRKRKPRFTKAEHSVWVRKLLEEAESRIKCANCGHAYGEHWGFVVKRNWCHVEGCDCRDYVEEGGK